MRPAGDPVAPTRTTPFAGDRICPNPSLMNAWPTQLSRTFVCRVAGARYCTLERLSAPDLSRSVDELLALETSIQGDLAVASATLYRLVGGAERPQRKQLISLRRDLYNLRPPSTARLERALVGVADEDASALRLFASRIRRLRELEAAFEEDFRSVLPRVRESFQALLRNASFRTALALSSTSLYRNLTRYESGGSNPTARDRKVERGLLRYYTRVAAKATPFSTFCTVLPVRPVVGTDVGGSIRIKGDVGRKRIFVRLNKRLYGTFFSILERRPGIRQHLNVRLNSTARSNGDGRIVYLASIGGREVFQRLVAGEALARITERLEEERTTTLGELTGIIASDSSFDASPEEAAAFLERLVEIGLLRLDAGVREQDTDWDIPFGAFLENTGDPHAREVAAFLRFARECSERYQNVPEGERSDRINELGDALAATLSSIDAPAPGRTIPFYEDATADAVVEISIDKRSGEAFEALKEWIQRTRVLAWPRAEVATMRRFFQQHYGPGVESVPLLTFYEDYYRLHFKQHLERVAQGGRQDDYNSGNPLGLAIIDEISEGRRRLAALMQRRWVNSRESEVIDLDGRDLDAALRDVPSDSGVAFSASAFAVLGEDVEGEAIIVLKDGGYAAGYGKFFSRFLYMLPLEVTEEIRAQNEALSEDFLAEICGDANHNANLHPPLLPWAISYPTGSGADVGPTLRCSELSVEPDPHDPDALCLRHAATGKRVSPVDLGFLNPRLRPPLYQLLIHFMPPVAFGPLLPGHPPGPFPEPERGTSEGTTNGAEVLATAGTDPPEPSITVRPRITFRRQLVLARRQWRVPDVLLPQLRPEESSASFFLRVNRWRAEHDIPERVYLKVHPARPPVAGSAPGQQGEPESRPSSDEGEATQREDAPHGHVPPPETASPAHKGEPEGRENRRLLERNATRSSRDHQKPQFIDFTSPLLVELFGRVGSALPRYFVTMEEQLPDPLSLASDGRGRYVTEFVVQYSFPAEDPELSRGSDELEHLEVHA